MGGASTTNYYDISTDRTVTIPTADFQSANIKYFRPLPLQMQIISKILSNENNITERRITYNFQRPDGIIIASIAFNNKYNSVNTIISTSLVEGSKSGNISWDEGNVPLTGYWLTIRFDKTSAYYYEGDTYTIRTRTAVFTVYPDTTISVDVTREERFLLNSQGGLRLFEDNLSDPRILITSQTLIDASDIGDTIFHIYNECSVNDLKITTFQKSCIKIVSVLKGEGDTSKDKVSYIYENFNIKIGIKEFGSNLIKYALLKYILSKLLYGYFNVDYLLLKYYDKFLRDLKDSRFHNFVLFFTTGPLSDYKQYFLCDN